jgi:lysozyme
MCVLQRQAISSKQPGAVVPCFVAAVLRKTAATFPPAALMLVMTAASACGAGAPPKTARGDLAPGAEGIDLSHHNGNIDWPVLAAENLDFIYLKATEGGDWKDPRFQANWQAASAEGYRVGAYHFYRLCRGGAVQADNFIRSVEVRAGTLPPAVDLEYSHNCTPAQNPAETRAELRLFLDRLEAEYGAVPVLYTTPDFHADWLSAGFERYPLWIRSLGGAPELPARIWQYSMRGKAKGIEGDVDRNRVMHDAPRD